MIERIPLLSLFHAFETAVAKGRVHRCTLSDRISGNCQADTTDFSAGQLWQCTIDHEGRELTDQVTFIVTGTARMREISTRQNFLNDTMIVSVGIADANPDVCEEARNVPHLGFKSESLEDCAPELIAEGDAVTGSETWPSLVAARTRWLDAMLLRRDVTIGLHPMRFLGMIERARCKK